MIKKVSTLEIRKRLGDILNRVALRHDEFIIERKGKALAAMVPIEKLEQLERLARQCLLDALTASSRPITPEEADTLSNEAKHKGRRRKPPRGKAK